MTRTVGRSAAVHRGEPAIGRRRTRLGGLLPIIAGVLALLLLGPASAGATMPTLETTFSAPEGGSVGSIAVNEETGEIFVVDAYKDAIDRYTSAGSLIEEIHGSSTKAGSFGFTGDKLDSVGVDNSGGPGQGNVYVNSREERQAFAFKLEAGVYKELWDVPIEREYKPTGLGVDRFGNPWVDVRKLSSVYELDPTSGAIVKEFPARIEAESIAFDSEDHMFVAGVYENGIVELDPATGNSLSSIFKVDPEAIAIDPTTNRRFVISESFLEVLTPAESVVEGTPFFVNTGIVAVNGAARKAYTPTGNGLGINVWRPPPIIPLTVSKSGGGSSSVVSAPAGIDCGPVCSAVFDEGETVVLTAVPQPDVVVSGWKGCAFEPSPVECEVSVGQASEVSVSFAKGVRLTVSKSGPGTVSSTPVGIKCGAHCAVPFPEGSKVVLAANVPPGEKVAWQGCMAEPVADECEVTLNEARNVSAVFSPIVYRLTVAKTGSGDGIVTCNGGPCLAEYPVGSTVELGGAAASGSAFVGFSGAGCSETTCDLVLESDVSVTVAFNQVLSAGAIAPTTPAVVSPPVVKAKPVVKRARCKRGYVKRKVRCVKAKKRGKSKKH